MLDFVKMAVRNVSEGHVMLVTVCGYEQNPSRVVGEVVHTRFWVVHTEGWTDGVVQILTATHKIVCGRQTSD